MLRRSLLLLLCVTAALVTIRLFPERRPNAVGFTNNVAEVEALLAGRAGSGGHFDAQIPREDAETLFKSDPARFVWDPYCYYVYKPGLVETRRWQEHPDRQWERRINVRGLREAGDPRVTDAVLGVLVTGDSHTDGACGNDETFAALLEERLRAREVDVEVLNTGVVGYSFYNYLGVLRRFLALHEVPDVFVVCVYGGNDFVEVLRPHHYLRGTTPPVRRTDYWDRIDKAKDVSSSFLAQTLAQVVFFQEHPSEFEVALDGADAALSRIVDTCRAQDSAWS